MDKENFQYSKWLFSIIVFILVTVAGTVICDYAVRNYQIAQRNDAREMLTTTTSEMSAQMAELMKSTEMLSAYTNQPTKNNWLQASKELMEQQKNLLGVEYIPAGQPLWEAPSSFHVQYAPGLWEFISNLQRTAAEGDDAAKLLAPILLPDGSSVTLVMTPRFNYNTRSQKFDYVGSQYTVWALPATFQKMIDAVVAAGYEYQIYGNNGYLPQGGIVAESKAKLRDAETMSIRVAGGQWVMSVEPVDGWVSREHQLIYISVSMLLGILVSCLFWRLYKK